MQKHDAHPRIFTELAPEKIDMCISIMSVTLKLDTSGEYPIQNTSFCRNTLLNALLQGIAGGIF